MKCPNTPSLTLSLFLLPAAALAHVDIASGPAFANTSQEITFSVGHGCSHAVGESTVMIDTSSVTIDIPASVTTLRAETSDFGKVVVTHDQANNPVSVTWTKPDGDLIATDDNFYKLTIRIKVPNAPFTTLFFPAHQTCKTPGGETEVVDWVETTSGGTGEPAPGLKIVPARSSGWNKFTVTTAIPDLSVYFKDALIVWKDSAAYSSNASTAALIASTPGVTALTAAAANDELWVKY